MCRSYLESKCTWGSFCNYAHSKEEMDAARKKYHEAMKQENGRSSINDRNAAQVRKQTLPTSSSTRLQYFGLEYSCEGNYFVILRMFRKQRSQEISMAVFCEDSSHEFLQRFFNRKDFPVNISGIFAKYFVAQKLPVWSCTYNPVRTILFTIIEIHP